MDNIETKMPMDSLEEAPNAPNAPADPPASLPQGDPQPRDEHGKFAPKQPEAQPQQRREPAGKPDPDQAYRRTAAERDQYKSQFETLQKRLNDMSAVARGEDPNAPKEDADPLKPLVEKVDGIVQRLQKNDDERQAEALRTQVLQYADADEQRFSRQQPDFQQAVQHYIGSRLKEMAIMGLSQQQAEAVLTQEANELLVDCAANNRSPAETLYGMATARGYVSGAAPRMPQPQPQQFQPQPQPQAYTRRSMGTGAGAPAGGVTAQQIAMMSEEDYNAFRATPEGAAAIRRAMGG